MSESEKCKIYFESYPKSYKLYGSYIPLHTRTSMYTTVPVCLTTYYTVKRENLAHSYLTANQLLIHWPELVLAHPFQKIKTSEQV